MTDPEQKAARARELEEMLRGSPDDDFARDELAHLLTDLGRASRDLGDRGGAERALRRALELRGELASRSGLRTARRDLARAHRDLAWLIERETRAVEAEALHRSALTLREALHADTPEDPEAAGDLAASLRDLASSARDQGRNAEAAQLLARAAALLDELVATTLEGDDRIALLEDLAWTRKSEAWLLERLGRMDGAADSLRDAIDIHERLVEAHPAHGDRARWQAKLGDELALLGSWLEEGDRLEEARKALSEAEKTLRAALEGETTPGTAEMAASDLVKALRSLELVLHVLGRREEALAARKRAKDAARRRSRS